MTNMNIDTSPLICCWRGDAGLRLLDKDLCLHFLIWRNLQDEGDPWNKRMLNFKDGMPRAVYVAESLMRMVFTRLLIKLNPDFRPIGLVVALSHDGTRTVGTDPLPKLARSLSRAYSTLGLKWLPNVLEKDKHTAMKDIKPITHKEAEIKNKYRCAKLPDNMESVIVLDDLVTTGVTFSEIARAIKAYNPNVAVHPIALGKNFNPEYEGKRDNQHIEQLYPADVIDLIWPPTS